MRVKALHRVAIGAPEVAATTRFYAELWGLACQSADPAVSRMRTGGSSHADYLVKRTAGRGLDHIAFAAADREALDELVAQARNAGGKVLQPTRDGGEGEEQASAILADPDRNAVHLVVPGAPASVGDAPAFGPRKIGHVVLWAKAAEAMERFYGALGFVVTDRTQIGMTFMRCNADHHTLALIPNPSLTGLQHIAFDVETTDGVMRQLGRLKKADVPCIWGPGRHGPGNNVFTYYQDPAGTIIEFYGELETFGTDPAEWTEKFWGPEHSGDLWGLAGPPPAVFRGQSPNQ